MSWALNEGVVMVQLGTIQVPSKRLVSLLCELHPRECLGSLLENDTFHLGSRV